MSNPAERTVIATTIELPSKGTSSHGDNNEDKWWEEDVSKQFPIKIIREISDSVNVEVDKPHEGWIIKTTLKNFNMDGISSIYSKENELMATLTFVNGIATGPCTIYKDGVLYFKGYFIDGYREGKGEEYAKNGTEATEGFYRRGKKLNIFPSKEMGRGYWEVYDEKGKITHICQKDDLGNNDGFCYFFSNGKIDHVSLFKEGEEKTLLKKFSDNGMQEYKHHGMVFEGNYFNSLEMGYPRKADRAYMREDGSIRMSTGSAKENGIFYQAKMLSQVVLKNRSLALILFLVTSLIFCALFLFGYLRGGPYEIGYEQESYNVESGNKNHLLKFSLSNYPNLKTISIGEHCFKKAKSFHIDGLPQLNRLIIGMNSFTHDGSSTGENAPDSFSITNCESLQMINLGSRNFEYFTGHFNLNNLKSLTFLKIESYCFQHVKGEFNLKGAPSIQSILIGDYSFSSITSVRFDGLNELKKIRIGRRSFTHLKMDDNYDKSKSFHILNCGSLELLEIGSDSFFDFAGLFELRNLSSLQFVQIGRLDFASFNFEMGDFKIEGRASSYPY